MSTIDGPFGATAGGSTLDLRSPARASSTRVSGALFGQLGLLAVLASGLLLCLAAVDTNTLLPQTIQPVNGPSTAVLAGPLAHLSFHLRAGEVVAALTLMFIGYVLAVRNAEYLSPQLVLGAVGAFIAIVLVAPPLFSTDLFSYQEYARMFFGPFHANPYTNNSQILALDPLHNYIGAKWISTPTVYGPLFTLLSGLFENTSSTAAIAFSAFAYKTIAALSAGGTLWLMWRSARLRGVNPVRAVALFGLNPLVIFYGIGGGHNDLLMMLFASAGIWALLSNRQRSSGALAVTAAAIKLTGGLLLPFALAANPGPGSTSSRRKVLFGAAAAAAVTLGTGFAVFGGGMAHMLVTLDQVQGEGGWQSAPGFLSSALHWELASKIISTLFGIAFAVICCRLLWRVWTNRMDWLDGAAWATFWLLMATSSMLPWYVSWLLVPVALCSDRRLWAASLWFTAWVQLTTMLPYIPHPPSVFGIQLF